MKPLLANYKNAFDINQYNLKLACFFLPARLYLFDTSLKQFEMMEYFDCKYIIYYAVKLKKKMHCFLNLHVLLMSL